MAKAVDVFRQSMMEANRLSGLQADEQAQKEKRMAALPNVPTMKELGFPIVVGTGRGIVMPAGVPREPVVAVENMLRRMMASKQWKDYSAGNNFEENFLDGAQFRKYLESRRDEFRDFLTHVGLLKK